MIGTDTSTLSYFPGNLSTINGDKKKKHRCIVVARTLTCIGHEVGKISLSAYMKKRCQHLKYLTVFTFPPPRCQLCDECVRARAHLRVRTFLKVILRH